MINNKNFYITTPIYYSSDKLHIGHSYCTVYSDVIARYHRLKGYNVLFVTGTDEHGEKIQNNAKKSNIDPKKFVDNIFNIIKELWSNLNISYDLFVRTTDSYHEKTVQNVFQKLLITGDIYKSKYTGKYCIPCESFWSNKQANDLCPECNKKLINFSEEAYFFKLSKYEKQILDFYNNNSNIIFPNTRLKEMINFVNSGLEDLCISRKKISWGIKVPFDNEYVIYVWFEALLNYISVLGYENTQYNNFNNFWPCNIHVIGKEITRFHLIIWPAILMALNIDLPKKIISHGWILLNGEKMSKSIGNVVDPKDLYNKFGTDQLRYFLMREFDVINDSQYSINILIDRINNDLCNNFGNLISRTFSMIDKYFKNTLKGKYLLLNNDLEHIKIIEKYISSYIDNMDNFMLKNSLINIMNILTETNKYIDKNQPWILYKNNNINSLYTVLYNVLENIRLSCIMFIPFIPETANKILNQLNYKIKKNDNIFTILKYGILNHNLILNNKKNILFPRIVNEK